MLKSDLDSGEIFDLKRWFALAKVNFRYIPLVLNSSSMPPVKDHFELLQTHRARKIPSEV